MSSVSDSPITAIFQEHHVYTVEKSMVAVVFRFLVSPNSFLSSNVFFHVYRFYQCSTHLYHKPVDFPGFSDIPSDISQLPCSSGRIQFFFLPRFNIHSVQLFYFKFPGMWFVLSIPQKSRAMWSLQILLK